MPSNKTWSKKLVILFLDKLKEISNVSSGTPALAPTDEKFNFEVREIEPIPIIHKLHKEKPR